VCPDFAVVDVLKHYNIGRIAIFGTRGAGGVISVFTKKGEIGFTKTLYPGQ